MKEFVIVSAIVVALSGLPAFAKSIDGFEKAAGDMNVPITKVVNVVKDNADKGWEYSPLKLNKW
jgi:hypothetical protein